MEGSSEAYDELIESVAERMPDVAAEVRAEVLRGRSVPASRIATGDREVRQQLLAEQHLGRINSKDVIAEPYDDDGRLILLLEALHTLTASMSAARLTLESFGHQHNLHGPYVSFFDPDQIAPERPDVTTFSQPAIRALDQATDIINAAIHDAGGFA